MAYESLNNSEVNNAGRVCGGRILAAGAARLYLASGKSWSPYATGAAVLVDDAAVGGKFIRLVDLTNNIVTFEQEIYEAFEYTSSRPFFHVFETETTVAALSFASEKDAQAFLEMVTKASEHKRAAPPVPAKPVPAPPSEHKPPIPEHKPPPVPGGIPPLPTKKPPPPPPGHAPPAVPDATAPSAPPAHTPPATATASAAPAPAAPAAPPPAVEKKASTPTLTPSTSNSKIPKPAPAPAAGGGLFGGLTSLFGGAKEQDNFVISAPTGFRHESHVGWDAQNGFEIRNIPPDWKKLFSDAGIKKSELKNPETSKFILETVAVAVMNKEAPSGAPVAPTAATTTTAAPAAPPSPAPHHHAPSAPLPKPPPPRPAPPTAPASPPAAHDVTPGGPEPAKPVSPRPAPPPPPPHAPAHGASGGPPPPPPPPAHGGPPPPPPAPTAGGPPPPPKAPSSHALASPAAPPGGGAPSDLLNQIRQGKSLKKADLPEIGAMKVEEKNTLVSTLASAMQARRAAIGVEETGDEDDSNWDD